MTSPPTDHRTTDDISRRQFIHSAALTAGGVTALAGCIDGPGGNRIKEGTGYGAFFTLADWGNQVGGDHFEFETPVEIGEIGHGWDPEFDVIGEAASRALFLYLDTPEFAWAQDVAATLSADHEEVTVFDAHEAIPAHELLTFAETRDAAGTPDSSVDPETFEVARFDIIDPVEGDIAAWWHDGHWHGGLPDVPLDGERQLTVHVEDSTGRIPPIVEDEAFNLEVNPAPGAPEDVFDVTVEGTDVSFAGREVGQSLVVFELHGTDGIIFETSSDPALVTVTEADEVTTDIFHDPHTWVAPHLARYMVEGVADQLINLDPDHAEVFAGNVDEYIAKIDEIDAQLFELVDSAEHTHVVFAGHHAFGYVGHRYGIKFHTPVGVSPDAEVTHEDVSGLIRVIEDHGLDTVLYDPFEAPDPDGELPPMVDVLIEETGVSPAPLSPAEGTTPQWREEGYGWLEQWTEINLPSLEAALSAGQS